MKIKNTLRIIDYSQSVLILILLFFVVMLVSRARTGFVLAFELCIGGAGIIVFLSRSVIVNRVLKKSAHPGLMYAVLEKLGYTQKLDLSLPDELLDEIYKPTYSTSEFLSENDLSPNNGPELEFTEKWLRLGENHIAWPDIYDWTYVKATKGTSARIIVNYYDQDRNIIDDDIQLDLSRNKIDVLLLLTHFKGKYGQTPNQ